MKAIKILLSFAMLCLILSFAFCSNEDNSDDGIDYPEPPTPTSGEDTCAPYDCEHDGAFCVLGQKLVDFCIFQDEYSNQLLSEEEVEDIICSLNAFWYAFSENMTAEAGDFNSEELSDAFNQIIVDSKELITNLVVSLIEEGILCEDNGEGGVAADSITDIASYITELSGCTECLEDPENPDNWPGEVWPTIGAYSSMLGLTSEDGVNIISTVIDQLDTDLNLTGIVDQINTEGGCTFSEDKITTTDYNANLIDLIDFLMDNSSDWDINTIVDGLLESEIPYLIDIFVDLLESIHTESNDLTAIAGLVPTLPSLLIGIITSDMNQCEEE